MVKEVRTLLKVGFIVLAFCACNEEDQLPVAQEKKIATFTSSIGGENYTRASDTLWDVDDEIGVFMKTTGSELGFASVLSEANNRHYITKDKMTFEAFDESQSIYYPEDNTAVDFIAYYPYQPALSSFVYRVNVSNQTVPEAIDLLYSDNVKNGTGAFHNSNLVFSHQLAKIKITVKTGEGVSSLDGLEVKISGVHVTADFNLADGNLVATGPAGNTVAFNVSGTSGEKIAEAILIPDDGDTERLITFTLSSGKRFSHKLNAGDKLEKNTRYTFTAQLKDGGTVVEPQTGYVETPLMSNLPANFQYVIHMLPDREGRNYSMLYDTENRLAHWVAYPLVPSYHVGNSGRSDAWSYDPEISENSQPDLSSGFPASNTDRGHQIPSGDRTYSWAANAPTFYYSNMTAQQSQLNQGMWASLEGKIRTWASRCDTMYVVTGAMIRTATDQAITYTYDKSSTRVARPKSYFKALAQRTGNNYTTIAFLINNEAPSSGDNYQNHRLDVKALEAETGFTFFPSLSDDIKGRIDPVKWN